MQQRSDGVKSKNRRGANGCGKEIEKGSRVIENRACFNLIELSNTTDDGGIYHQKRLGNTLIPMQTWQSPWKHKNKLKKQPRTSNQRKQWSELQHVRNVHIFKRRTSQSKLNERSNTQPKQRFCSMPKLLKTQLILPEIEHNSHQESHTDNRTWVSHQVLHITRTFKEITPRSLNINSDKGIDKIQLLPSCSNLECRPPKLKDKRQNDKIDKRWQQRVKVLKQAKRKHLKRLFIQSDSGQFSSKKGQLSTGGMDEANSAVHNQVSRVLFQKYKLLCDQGKQNCMR